MSKSGDNILPRPQRPRKDGPDKTRRGRPVGDREAKRKELVRAGIAVLADLGYAGTSLRKVARRAGHTTGAVTYYFDNKQTMIGQILGYVFDQYDEYLQKDEMIVDVKEAIRQSLVANSELDLWSAQFQLLAQARHDPAIAQVYQRRYADYRETFTAILASKQRHGTIRDDIPADLLADQVSAMVDGWMMMMPLEPERFAPDRLERLLASLTTMIEKTGARAEAKNPISPPAPRLPPD